MGLNGIEAISGTGWRASASAETLRSRSMRRVVAVREVYSQSIQSNSSMAQMDFTLAVVRSISMSTIYKRGPIHLGQAEDQGTAAKAESLPAPNTTKDHPPRSRAGFLPNVAKCIALTALALYTVTYGIHLPHFGDNSKSEFSDVVKRGLAKCEAIKLMPPDTTHFRVNRTISDRFEPNNANPVLLQNATVWTGGDDGEEVLFGASIYLKGGVVVSVGTAKDVRRQIMDDAVEEIDVEGRWITPGIIDM